jgi:prevent-host-death family protein
MKTVPITDAKARLNDYVGQAQQTHEQVTITRQGSPAAVLVSAEEWQALQDTLFWLSQGAATDITAGQAEHEAGQTHIEDDIRRRFNVPTR